MKKKLIIIVSIIVALALIMTGVIHCFRRTPEYAMMIILKDVKESGLDGLRPHLTDKAQKTIDTVSVITDSKLLNKIIKLLDKKNYASVLKTEIQQIQWGVDDIMKGKKHTDVILTFNYDDRLVGTIELSMVRSEDGWKIDGLELPQFEEINW